MPSSSDDITPHTVGAFMCVMITVFHKCQIEQVQTKDGHTIDFASLIDRAGMSVLDPSTGVNIPQSDRDNCFRLLAMLLERFQSYSVKH